MLCSKFSDYSCLDFIMPFCSHWFADSLQLYAEKGHREGV
jgi:hypothetical protein